MAPEIKYTKLFIDNEWVDAVSGKTFDTYNPHDGSVIATVAEGDEADINLAVAAAKRAFHRNSEWRLMDASQRWAILDKFADLVQRDSQYLAELECCNNGMLLSSAIMSLKYGVVENIRYLASLADKIQGDTIPLNGEVFAYTLKQPVGVCGLILPWNGPILLFVVKVVAALAAGCTVVVKPAEQTPLTALVLAALLQEAGVPAGVVNVVNGFGVGAGTALTHHPDVAKISFTGSLEVGKLIQQAAGANNLKRVTLELGGKSPLVIMDDADLNVAIPYAAFSIFSHQGQMCIAASRVYVQSRIYDKFVQGAVAMAKKRVIGNPTDPATEHGPQIDAEMFNKVMGYIESGKKDGAKVLTGGKRVGNTGYYIEPTVFVDVTDDMKIAKEEECLLLISPIEHNFHLTLLHMTSHLSVCPRSYGTSQIFGPVQCILKFDTLEEVIDRCNNTNYGLAAGIFTNDLNTALQFGKHAEVGKVWINTYLMMGPQAPSCGWKDSSIGIENGLQSVDAFLELKTVTINLPKKF
ncbi:Retinal dehydrogenase 1 [Papilio machaon]|uniref:Retinal dehydrogenase 1 n=1 Tax=Papilio machaon TaxID=76193 RepID=A0A194RSB1_PAPMA|nr:Retinal dehydrogenase 1 [Papilio machaon]